MSSGAADACWGKSSDQGALTLSLSQHLDDAQAVLAHLWDDWLPEAVKLRIATELPVASARSLARLLASWHDVGKATPAFAVQQRELLAPMERAGLHVDQPRYVEANRRRLPHALAGACAVQRWLVAQGWTLPAANALAAIVGGHHGAPPEDLRHPDATLMGDAAWSAARNELLQRMVTRTGAEPALQAARQRPPGRPEAVLLSALVIVADWLASNVELFPYEVVGTTDARAAVSWERIGLPAPWRAGPVDLTKPVFWAERFSLTAPRPVQLAVDAVLADGSGPGMLIIEAPMGEGKTEAALAAAEVLAHRHGCGGVLVALPTMATSNAMFTRLLNWLDHLPRPADGGRWSTYLAHGKAGLNDSFRGLHDGVLRGIGEDEPGGVAVAHSWLSGRKKGVLSTFVVGTIDQVLVGALRSKHLALRHLSLAGKVVVLDEVHAADVYMSVYLDRVLTWLGAYHVPVVLLSATLPPHRRSELENAYRAGLVEMRSPQLAQDEVDGYPLLTLVDGGGVHRRVVPASGRTSRVVLERLDDAALVSALTDRLAAGGTAAVVCNTVTRAQERARLLTVVFGTDVVLLHSRFLAADRAALEQRVLDLLGPPGSAARPARLVLVGTQVLEQSLDIDVDVMVTDLAPVDLVLQRVGRLHRHARETGVRPSRVCSPRLLVTGVEDWAAATTQGVRGSRWVYGEAALLRSVTVLRPFLDGRALVLPDDIAPLVRDGYAPYDSSRAWPPELAAAEVAADRERAERRGNAQVYLLGAPGGESKNLLSWLHGGTEEESAAGQAAVRDGTQGVEVLLLQDRNGALHLPEHVPYGGTMLGGSPSEQMALAALGCAVRLPDRCTGSALGAELSRPEWSHNRWLRDVLVLSCSAQGDALHVDLGPHHLSYRIGDGLTVTSGAA